MAGDKERFLEAGFADYQAKPLDFTQLGCLSIDFRRPWTALAAVLKGPLSDPTEGGSTRICS